VKKNNNLALETELRNIREYYQARVNKTICKMNFNSKQELKECGIIGQRVIRNFESISEEELNILLKDFRIFLILFATELRNMFRTIFQYRKSNKQWQKESFIEYMLEVTNIHHNLPEIFRHLDEKTFSQYDFDFLASLIESFVLKWWCPDNPELQKLLFHFSLVGLCTMDNNSLFYANRMYDLITEIRPDNNKLEEIWKPIINLLKENEVQLIINNNIITYKKDIAEMTYEITDMEKFKNNFLDVLHTNLIDFLSMLDS